MVDTALIQQLQQVLGAGNVLLDEPMSSHTTFAVGGPADVYVLPRSIDEVRTVLALCADANVDVHFVGCGSDLLVADAGVRGVVVQLRSNFNAIEVGEGGVVRAQAGATNKQVAQAAWKAGLTGYEFASGIPGTIGGAAIMNAGAYDGQFADVARSCTCLTRAGELIEVPAREADWRYRHSMMDEAGLIVLGAVLQLQPGDPDDIKARMDELLRRRAEKQPIDVPSAGSTFKRPEGYFAGALIQQAGMQGFTIGGAQVSLKHAGFVVNTGGATAADVRGVIEAVQQAVWDYAGVMLEPEVRFWGF